MYNCAALKQPATRARRLKVAAAAGPVTSKAKQQLREKAIAQQLIRSFLWFTALYLDRWMLAARLVTWVPLQSQLRLLLFLYFLVSLSFASKTLFKHASLLRRLL
jgi:hypothetical protein